MAVLSELERELSGLSHSEDALSKIRQFSEGLKDMAARVQAFNADKAFVRKPISRDETSALGFNLSEDHFALLQGDVVSTEAAFLLGERVSGNPKFVVLNSSCDLSSRSKEVSVPSSRRRNPEGCRRRENGT